MDEHRKALAAEAKRAACQILKAVEGYLTLEEGLARWDAGEEAMSADAVEHALRLLESWDDTLLSFLEWAASADRRNKARGVVPEDNAAGPVVFTLAELEYLEWASKGGRDVDRR